MYNELQREINLLETIFILILLSITFYLQFFDQQLPCPLCLLQRWGLLGIAFGFLLNARAQAIMELLY